MRIARIINQKGIFLEIHRNFCLDGIRGGTFCSNLLMILNDVMASKIAMGSG